MTQLSTMVTDRVGGIVYNAIEGEKVSYNGTEYTYTGAADIAVKYDETADITTYTIKLRDDLKFSDGQPADIDDLIFTYYVYLDPSYAGSTTLNSYDIVGLKAYMTQIPEDSLATVAPTMDALKAAPAGYTVAEGDLFTQAQYDAYQAAVKELWRWLTPRASSTMSWPTTIPPTMHPPSARPWKRSLPTLVCRLPSVWRCGALPT